MRCFPNVIEMATKQEKKIENKVWCITLCVYEEWEIAKWIRCTEFVITVVLNITLLCMLQKKRSKSNLVFFVFNLAIADLGVAFLHILPHVIKHFTGHQWILGIVICKIKFYVSNVSSYASTYLIVIISIDRLLCVIQPMSVSRKTNHYRKYMIAVPWLLSVIINIPLLFWTRVFRRCVVSKAKRKSTVMTFVVSITFISCWLPSILAGLLNLYGHFGYGGWFDILIALAPLNSMLNPIIFFVFNYATFTSSNRSPIGRNTQELNTYSTKSTKNIHCHG
ncbi:unnamed protein product [Mytilus coruscus]|uniref:G-protein coupled receptors family 1 profile domain-containing protein n=1 Tax=Mytilus coruscus TaxID=42192 RepID=A0A6J8C2L9_MYTCO|nr:unnamed protein product [Mytilus coruscus]